MLPPAPLAFHPAIITIDGPAGSGKSTVGFALAERLGFLFFDSGVMYRSVTFVALERGLDVANSGVMGALSEALDIDVLPPGAARDGRHTTVVVDGRDVTWQIRSPAVDRAVSAVSAHARVRQALAAQQRRIGLLYGSGRGDKAGIVMVGRDIGTVILPEAPLKVYLDATPEERARRRHAELLARGRDVPLDEVLADVIRRDAIDSGRAHSPLRRAADAVVIDSTGLEAAQVVERIVALARAAV